MWLVILGCFQVGIIRLAMVQVDVLLAVEMMWGDDMGKLNSTF